MFFENGDAFFESSDFFEEFFDNSFEFGDSLVFGIHGVKNTLFDDLIKEQF